MREAIDYNALSWIRQEVSVTLKQARLELEDYAEGERRTELLQGCVAHLHEARGPLQMVNIKGADMLACEMEEAIADLLLESVAETDTLLEQLMQGFLELPEYLANLRSGKQDNPKLLFPLINSLRASRGLQPLKEDAVFSPDLSAHMPVAEFDGNAVRGELDLVTVARTARVRFQSGLLEWYRDSETNHGLQILVEVLEHLQETARSEQAARVWWVGAGVAELLRDGIIDTNPAVKRLFGQLDRQIKQLMDSGETTFTDALTEDLVRNLLFRLAGVETTSGRIATIRSTYGIAAQAAHESVEGGEDLTEIGDELLQTVSATAQEAIDHIKERIDEITRTPAAGADVLAPVADDLHLLGNTLGMIGLDGLGAKLSDGEQHLRGLMAEDGAINDADFNGLANTLVAVEDALSDITGQAGYSSDSDDHADAVLRQGQLAVVNAIITDISSAKDSINDFLNSSGDFDLLRPTPVLLNKICGGLELVGEEQLAFVARQVRNFISTELLDNNRTLTEDELDSLADAICSIEYCVEELCENHRFGERAIEVAVSSLEKLGYSAAELPAGISEATSAPGIVTDETTEPDIEPPVSQAHEPPPVQDAGDEQPAGAAPAVHDSAVESPGIAQLQVVAPDADSEIVEIFIEEADEVLDKLAVDIPVWAAHPDDLEMLAEIRRAFHTIKGSGRMVGAMATGELAWTFENLLNSVIDGTVPVNSSMLELLVESTSALKDLVAQVRNPDTVLLTDVSALGREVADLSLPAAGGVASDEVTVSEVAVVPGDESDAVAETGLPDEPGQDVTGFSDSEGDLETLAEKALAAGAEQASEIYAPLPSPDIDASVTSATAGHTTDYGDVNGISEVGVQDTAEPPGIAVQDPTRAEEFSVLTPDADPEIVEIFLEEANEELGSISLKIPEWIQQPGDSARLGEIRRSLHTLKGSGRMAGAMLIGEFAWSMEVLLNRLLEGVVKPGGSLFALFSQVPQAVSSLLRQVQDGTAPDMDIYGMMKKAADLGHAELVEVAEVHDVDACMDAASTAGDTAGASGEDDDSVLMELFGTESREHLATLAAVTATVDGKYLISDTHYRALHTLSGISESASVPGICRLAAALYDYFGDFYQENLPVVPDAFTVLHDCVHEMSTQLQRLPDRNFDESIVSGLLERIAQLPPAGAGQPPVQKLDDDVESVEPGREERASVPAAALDAVPELPAAAPHASDEPATDSGTSDMEPPEVEIDAAADAGPATTEPDVETAATENTTAATARDEVDIYAGMDKELYEIFVEEAGEIIDSSENVLRNWSESPDSRELMADFQRLLHTLKGGARMVDLSPIGDLSHALESLLSRVADEIVPASDDLFALLQDSHDRLAEMLEKVKSRAPVAAATDLESRLGRFMSGDVQATPATPAADETVVPASGRQGEVGKSDIPPQDVDTGGEHDAGRQTDDLDQAAPTEMQPWHEPVDQGLAPGLMAQALVEKPQIVERRKEGRARSELVRVQSEVLDNLVNNAGEINIYRARMEQQISNFRFNLTELNQTISRLRDQLRQLEIETEAQILYRYEQESESRNQDFDPLEMDRYSKLQQLSRSLIESISDLRSLQTLMEMTTRDSETLLLQQSRVSTDLQEGLIRTRMIPFAGLAPRLRRIVRQSARQLDKKVDLNLRGAEGEMDRAVIERIVAPLEHMLRNAVAHGIESPDRRVQVGKRAAGNITIELDREGSEIVLRIIDDGAGLDIDAIRARAIERGLMSANADLPDSDAMQFVLQTGFSTAIEVTQIAGRGVGMDVVNSEVKQLGGSLHIDSEAGKGSVFTIRLPYTLAINQALLITVGEQTFCVPMGSIEGVVTATSEQLQRCYEDGGQEFDYAGQSYQLMHLGSLLGICRMDLEMAGTQIPVLLVRVGDKRIGMQVDSLLGSREVVIKPLGAQLSLVDGITGATILGDGSVVMILDMFAVSRMKVREQTPQKSTGTQEDSRLVVMVVDDSITVRKVTSRLLERSGYKVMTAKDGVDAMGLLRESVPDMMLLDIEMPRMDGFELATHMRNDERLKHVPIIMITSRTGDKHRDHAFEIGVNDYLGKPYQESELLTSINNIIGVATMAVGT